jgi:hypothetical protein
MTNRHAAALLLSVMLSALPAQALDVYGLYSTAGKEILPCKFAEIRYTANDEYDVTPLVGGPAPGHKFAVRVTGAVKANRLAKPTSQQPRGAELPSGDSPYGLFSLAPKTWQCGLKHSDGRVIFPPSENTLGTVIPAGDGLFTVGQCFPTYTRTSLLDQHGIVATLPLNIASASQSWFTDGLMAVTVTDEVTTNTSIGPTNKHQAFIDHKGKICVSLPPGAFASPYSDGVTSYGVRKNGLTVCYIVDTAGKRVNVKVPDAYPEKFSHGRAVLSKGVEKERRFGLVRKDGKILLPPLYDVVENYANYVLVKKDSKFSVLDLNMTKRFSFPENTTSVMPCGDNGWFPYAVGGTPRAGILPNEPYDGTRYGFVDATGKVRVNPQFMSASGFQSGSAQVGNPLVGTIDESGKFLIPAKFKTIKSTGDGAIVTQEIAEFVPRVPESLADLDGLLKAAEASPDMMSLRRMQNLAFAWAVGKNDKPIDPKFLRYVMNKECPYCHSADNVQPVGGLGPIYENRWGRGNCEVSFADPRWRCIEDDIVF